jgi:hypothetical protein
MVMPGLGCMTSLEKIAGNRRAHDLPCQCGQNQCPCYPTRRVNKTARANPLPSRSEQSKSGIEKCLFIDVSGRISLIDIRYQFSQLTRIAEM